MLLCIYRNAGFDFAATAAKTLKVIECAWELSVLSKSILQDVTSYGKEVPQAEMLVGVWLPVVEQLSSFENE